LANDRAALTRQIREANDIVAVISGYLPLISSGNPNRFKGLCPFHDDHRPSMQVDSKWQNFRCWTCGKFGDVFNFIQEYEKVSFLEARAILARRANIALTEDNAANTARLQQLEVLDWAAKMFNQCLLDSPLAESARIYLGDRKLSGDTVRKFNLGYSPGGDWLLNQLGETGVPIEVFETVGLIARSDSGGRWYERFRDRVMFPVRDTMGRTVGFGGRVIPGTAAAEKGPKYYNSPDSPVFNKSELCYGLDFARTAARSAGYIAVVEGYTDVLMAHQMGVPQVVATMGTALTPMHVQQFLRVAPRVVLVYDADQGGSTGVDRALSVFASHDVELAIATLPENMDPFDLLVQQGPEPFKKAMESASSALDYKMDHLLEKEAGNGIEGQRRVIDAMLNVIAIMPDAGNASVQVKRELMLTRIAQRLGVPAEMIRARLRELRSENQREERGPQRQHEDPDDDGPKSGPAPALERELLELLLADHNLVAKAQESIAIEDLTHPGLRKLLDGLYDLVKAGEIPDLDALRSRIADERLISSAMRLMDVGQQSTANRDVWFKEILTAFQRKKDQEKRERLRSQLAGVTDPSAGIELLKKLKNETVGTER
jgi:DNA primase